MQGAMTNPRSRRDLLRTIGLAGVAATTAGLAACGPRTYLPGPEGSAPPGVTTSSTDAGLRAELEGLSWPTSPLPEPTSPVTLTIASTWVPSDLDRQKAFDDYFTERHPNIKLVREVTPFADFLQKYLTQMAGGSLPDIMVCQFAWASQLISKGVYLPLDDYLASSPDFQAADIQDVAISYYKDAGKTYCVPFDCGPIVTFYNKDLFQQNNLALPTDSWTMDDMRAAALAITKGSGASKTFGFSSGVAPSAYWSPLFLQPFGGRYLNQDETKCQLTDPASVAAAEWWTDLTVAKGTAPTASEGASMKDGAFAMGRAGMAVMGSWNITSLKAYGTKFDWALAGMPKGPSARTTPAVGSGFGITKDCKNRDAAWIYLNEYLSAPGINFMWVKTGHGSPPRKSLWADYLKLPDAPEGATVLEEAMNSYATSDGVTIKPTTTRIGSLAAPIWDRVTTGALKPADACAQIAAALDPVLAANA